MNQRSNWQQPLDHRKCKRISEKHRLLFIDYVEVFDSVNHNKLWKTLKEMGIPEHLTYLLRNLCAGQEATARIRREAMDWFKLGKECHKTVYCHPDYFIYMQNISC